MDNDNNILSESGYARVINMMRGVVPNVKTFGIITGENPHGMKTPKQENKERNIKLEKELKDKNFGFIKIKGKYGTLENPFFIPNVTKKEVIEIGNKAEQESVIFGFKSVSKKRDGMVFEFIATEDWDKGKIISKREVFFAGGDWDDNYSILKGRKFKIPFYDEMLKYAAFKKNSGMVNKMALKREDIEQINEWTDKSLDENRTHKSRWMYRGNIKNKLFDVMEEHYELK